MALTADELARLKRMAGEAHKPDAERLLTDTELQDIADEAARVRDSADLAPLDVGYVDTYDLYMAAAEAWRQKAGIVSEQFDFESEGGRFVRSQQYEQYLRQASRYAGMASQLAVDIGQSVQES